MMGRNRTAVQYTRAMRKRYGMWPAWLPDARVAVGDYGRIHQGMFVRTGHLESSDLDLVTSRSASPGDHIFSTTGVRQATLNGDAALPTSETGARARIDFGSSFGLFIAVAGSREVRLEDPVGLAEHLKDRVSTGHWHRDHCVVTSVFQARSALIAVGSSRGGHLEIEGGMPTPDLLTWLTSGVNVLSETNVSYRAIVRDGCTPLFRVAVLVRTGELNPRGAQLNAPRLREVDARIKANKPEPSRSD
jgi:hypothetical protein